MNQTTIDRETFETILESAELDPAEVIREGYSGRYMYGASCLAVSLDSHRVLARLMVAAGRMEAQTDGEFDADALAGATCTDNLGFGLVAYWPGFVLTGEAENAECDLCGEGPDGLDPMAQHYQNGEVVYVHAQCAADHQLEQV